MQLEPGRLGPGTSVAAYLRVAPKGSTGLPAPAAGEKAPAYPFEDVYFTELRSTGTGQPLKLTRAFAAPPGTYDVYFAIRERPAAATAPDAPVKVAILKQELMVPNYHADELQTSSVIVADKIEQLTAPLTPEAMQERPYVLGDSEISPAADMKFKKTEELQRGLPGLRGQGRHRQEARRHDRLRVLPEGSGRREAVQPHAGRRRCPRRRCRPTSIPTRGTRS